MKNIFVFFLIALFMDGVFGESVSVTERDSVTLHTGLSEIQKDDVIDWRFKNILIAQFEMENKKISLYDVPGGRFKDRLKLDSQTGDLTIRNIRTEHTGDYEVSNYYTLKRSFSVSVVSAVVPPAAVKSVMEGDSVTLQTDLTDTQRDAVIQWRFGQQKSPVAKINRAAGIFNTFDVLDERFRGRLKLDHQTGSLTITDTRTTDSGTYEAEISSSISNYTIHHTQSFTVTVRAVPESGWSSAAVAGIVGGVLLGAGVIYYCYKRSRDAVKSVKKGDPVTLPITEIQNDDLIVWMFGDIKLAEINKADLPFYKCDCPDERFRNRLKLDPQTGSLIITNTTTEHTGVYKLMISSSRYIINQRFFVLVTESGWSSAAVAGIVDVVCFLLSDAGAGVINCCCKKSRDSGKSAGRFLKREGNEENEYDSP